MTAGAARRGARPCIRSMLKSRGPNRAGAIG